MVPQDSLKYLISLKMTSFNNVLIFPWTIFLHSFYPFCCFHYAWLLCKWKAWDNPFPYFIYISCCKTMLAFLIKLQFEPLCKNQFVYQFNLACSLVLIYPLIRLSLNPKCNALSFSPESLSKQNLTEQAWRILIKTWPIVPWWCYHGNPSSSWMNRGKYIKIFDGAFSFALVPARNIWNSFKYACTMVAVWQISFSNDPCTSRVVTNTYL